MLKKIRDDINKRMSEYTDSRQPTGDEVAMAWLLCEIGRLEEEVCRLSTKVDILKRKRNWIL